MAVDKNLQNVCRHQNLMFIESVTEMFYTSIVWTKKLALFERLLRKMTVLR